LINGAISVSNPLDVPYLAGAMGSNYAGILNWVGKKNFSKVTDIFDNFDKKMNINVD